MIKINKLAAIGLAAVTAMSAMSVSAMAENSNAVNNEEIRLDTASIANTDKAIFIEQDGDVVQVEPLDCDDENGVSVSLKEGFIIVEDTNGNTIQQNLISSCVDEERANSYIYTRYIVTANGVNMWKTYARKEVVLTLEKGVSFWSNGSLMDYREGYVVTNSENKYGCVSSSYLKLAE